MGWFIVMLFTIAGKPADPSLADMIATKSYASYAGCMADAAALAAARPRPDIIHGGYLCMRHGESDRALAATRKVRF